jgi:hypothetical protein
MIEDVRARPELVIGDGAHDVECASDANELVVPDVRNLPTHRR